MCKKTEVATEYDPFIIVFAKKTNGQIEDGFTTHPHPSNLHDRVQRMKEIGNYSAGDFPVPGRLEFSKEKSKKLNRWMKNDCTIYVRISYNQIPEVVWAP